MIEFNGFPIVGKKIDENPEQVTVTGNEKIPLIIDGVTKYVKLSNIIIAGVAGNDGAKGDIGDDGEKGWSPVIGIFTASDKKVFKVVNWVGGEGQKPATGQYIGATGLVTNIADAVQIDYNLSTKADLINGVVPANQLPSYVDDVLEFANLAALPVTGESGKIYVTIDTNLQYRWSGSAYIAIGGGTSTFAALPDSPYDNPTLASILSAKQDKLNQLISGCVLTPGATSSLTAGSWRINGVIYPKPTNTSFNNISLSGTGLFRTVAFYGLLNNTIEKVESAQLPAIVPPSNEIPDKALLRYMIVGDSTFTNEVIDYEKFALKADLGNRNNLTTEDKTTLVAATNEVKGQLNSILSDQITLKIFKISNYGTP